MINKLILLFSNEPWGDVWYSKHHYAIELAKNNIVFFINPSYKWRIKDLLRKNSVNKINNNLYVLTCSNIFPFTSKSTILKRINEYYLSKKIKKTIDLYNPNFYNTIFWSFDPFRFDNPSLFTPEHSLYLRMDNYSNVLEKSLVSNVDCFVACSSFLLEKYKFFSNKSLLIDHAVQKHDYSIEDILKYEYKKNAVLVANLNYRTDWEALKSIVLHFSNWTFNIIGPLDKESLSSNDFKNYKQIKNKDNITFWGAKPYSFVTQKILESELCLCLYKPDIGGQLNSLKLIQYASFGKKILSSVFYLDNKELGDYITFSSSKDDYIQNFEKLACLSLSAEEIRQRLEFTANLSYKGVIEKIYQKVISLKCM